MPHMASAGGSCGRYDVHSIDDTRVDVLIPPDAAHPSSLVLNKPPRRSRDARPRRFVFQHTFEGVGERRGVVRLAQETRLAMSDQLSMATDIGGDEHASLRHRL